MPITSKQEYELYLKADMGSGGGRRWRWHHRFRADVAHFVRLLRRAEYVTNCLSGFIPSLFLKYLKWQLRRKGRYLGLEIPVNVFGPGLVIVHPCGIVVSRHARVGKNCRIHAGVNIGEHRGGAPIVGDNVYLGPGSKIVGTVSVGSNSVVGANAVVVRDVPPGVTVGGVPARVLSEQDSSYVIRQDES